MHFTGVKKPGFPGICLVFFCTSGLWRDVTKCTGEKNSIALKTMAFFRYLPRQLNTNYAHNCGRKLLLFLHISLLPWCNGRKPNFSRQSPPDFKPLAINLAYFQIKTFKH